MQSAMHNRFGELLIRHLSGDISEAEQVELDEMIATSAAYKKLFNEFSDDPHKLVAALKEFNSWNVEACQEMVMSNLGHSTKTILFLKRLAAAAALLVGIGFLTWYIYITWYSYKGKKTGEVKYAAVTSNMPYKAKLNTGDGQVIDLTKKANGRLKEVKSLPVIKNDSQLVYLAKHALPNAVTNTLQTPNGGLFQLTLSDGTRVWLNASSTIFYPTSFNEKERRVKITGEAYFEVKKDPSWPFIIETPKMEVLVYGTLLNIKAYADEEPITTLIEGAVTVKAAQDSAVLKPGEQAVLTKDEKIKKGTAVISKANAWRQGNFNFQGDNLESIMQELARWYDYQLEFNVPRSNEAYSGAFFLRSSPLPDILDYIRRATGHHIFITGKSIKVNP